MATGVAAMHSTGECRYFLFYDIALHVIIELHPQYMPNAYDITNPRLKRLKSE
jgi:hypothetical protein